jgi:O-antigen ligase
MLSIKHIISEKKAEIIGILASIVLGVLSGIFGVVYVFAGIIAILLITYMLYRPDDTTVIILFALYANLAVVAIKFFNVPSVIAGASFILLIIPIMNYLFVRREPLILDQLLLMMIMYAIALLISGIASGRMADALDRIVSYLVEGLILYFLVVNAVRNYSQLRKATWALILSGVLMGSLSMYQEFTKSYHNQFGGLAQVKESVIGTGETDMFGRKVKRQRLAGPIGSKNRYAQIMVVLLPLAFFRMLGEKKRSLKWLAAISCIPILAGALLTFSRGAGITIFLLLVLMTFLRYIKVWQFVLAMVLAVGVVFIAVPDYVYRTYKAIEGLTSVASNQVEEADASVKGRATVGLAALHMFLDHPILGVGPGLSQVYMIEYSKEGFRKIDTERRAHNMYLEELADTGIVGFTLFMAIIFFVLFSLARLRRQYKDQYPQMVMLATGYMLGLVGYLLTAVFLHLSYVRYFWVIIALCGATIHIFDRYVVEQARNAQTSKADQPAEPETKELLFP